MNKQLIILQGRSNVGKSTSLNILYKLLLANPVAKLIWFEALGRKLDFIATISIEGQLVGIFNRGDVPAEVEKSLQLLMLKKCRVIVGAAHGKGEINDVLASAERACQLVQVPKKASLGKSLDISNQVTAHTLASMIYAALIA